MTLDREGFLKHTYSHSQIQTTEEKIDKSKYNEIKNFYTSIDNKV